MDPQTALLISQGLSALIGIWAQHASKPKGWIPTDQDWDDMLALNAKTADDYKTEAAKRLGIPWPPA